jgi:hypothetical protein
MVFLMVGSGRAPLQDHDDDIQSLINARELSIQVVIPEMRGSQIFRRQSATRTPRGRVFPPFCVATMPNWNVILKRESHSYVRVHKQFRKH